MNETISGIFNSSDSVRSGSKQIAESAMHLANGVTNQASSVEELNAAITVINE